MSDAYRILRETYRARRVLVTGHTGFKGSWLCSWLLELEAQVAGIALDPDTDPNLFEALQLNDRVDSHICDVRNHSDLNAIVLKIKPEIIFHLAAQPLVRRSYADPVGTFATNAMGTAHVLEAARACDSVRAVVVVTTDKVYENHDGRPYRESDPLGGLDPYSASKAAAEIFTAVYQKNLARDRIAIATARGGNVIGGGDWSEDRIVPDIVRAIVDDVPIVLRNPEAVRPWQHVLELTEAYLQLGAQLFSSRDLAQSFNFGPEPSEVITVRKLTEAMLEIWGRTDHVVKIESSPLHEAHVLRLDIAKALSMLTWRPRLGLHRAVQWTVSWYKDYYEDSKSAATSTRDQICSFINLMDVEGRQ